MLPPKIAVIYGTVHRIVVSTVFSKKKNTSFKDILLILIISFLWHSLIL